MLLPILGDIAVPVFFVLSGFVIRYVTRTRESTAREYFIDRASRIYSVAFLAMEFTLVVSAICFLINREVFIREWGIGFSRPVSRLVLNLTFLSQAWGHNTMPFVDSPFWSLGYECIYYVFYGFLFFFRGWKRAVLFAAMAIAIGPQVVFLFPIWWLGCWVYELYQWCRGRWIASAALSAVGIWLVSGLILFLAGRRGVLFAPIAFFRWIAGLKNPLESLGFHPMRASMFAVATGVLCSITLLFLLFAMDRIEIARSNCWATRFRRVADGTFTLYLMHYPFLVLVLFLGILRPQSIVINVLLFVAMSAILIAVAVPVDTFKLSIRRWLHSVWPG